ncbi:MAG TPA: amidohydrolase family protein [Gemmatimonadaceae bacterium]
MRFLVEAANTVLGVEDGRIVSPFGHFDVVLRVSDGELRPGLINAHDHLHRNHYGRLGFPPYRNAYEWGDDIHARCADTIAAGRAHPRAAALRRGAEKNLRAGVTTVAHHDPWERDFEDAFPVRVLRIRCAHALRSLDDSGLPADSGGPFMIHLAEGVDDSSAAEVCELDRRGLVNRNLLAVHVVGADRNGISRLRAAGAGVIWCPSSNFFMFGRTTPPDLLASGIDVLIGSDSLLSGAGTLLDELRVARELGLLADDRLIDSVGAVAARRFGIDPPSLNDGARADFAVFRKPILEATAADVALVVAGGRLRVLDPELVSALGKWASAGTISEMAGVHRWTALSS